MKPVLRCLLCCGAVVVAVAVGGCSPEQSSADCVPTTTFAGAVYEGAGSTLAVDAGPPSTIGMAPRPDCDDAGGDATPEPGQDDVSVAAVPDGVAEVDDDVAVLVEVAAQEWALYVDPALTTSEVEELAAAVRGGD